jgi:hypothetical protein
MYTSCSWNPDGAFYRVQLNCACGGELTDSGLESTPAFGTESKFRLQCSRCAKTVDSDFSYPTTYSKANLPFYLPRGSIGLI